MGCAQLGQGRRGFIETLLEIVQQAQPQNGRRLVRHDADSTGATVAHYLLVHLYLGLGHPTSVARRNLAR